MTTFQLYWTWRGPHADWICLSHKHTADLASDYRPVLYCGVCICTKERWRRETQANTQPLHQEQQVNTELRSMPLTTD